MDLVLSGSVMAETLAPDQDAVAWCRGVCYTTSMDTLPNFPTPDQFAALIKADYAKFGRIIKSANIKVEN